MKTILLPTDFSTNALHASKYAAMLAKRLKAKVVLLNIYSVATALIAENAVAYETENFILQTQKEAQGNLDAFAKTFVLDAGLAPAHVTTRVEYGMVSDVILQIAKSINADMIVMGTLGASGVIDKWLGTTAQRVMEMAECPVWIIPKNAATTFPQKIMYASNLKENEAVATQQVLDIAKPLGATCKLVHIHDYFELNVGHGVEEMIGHLENEFKNQDATFQHFTHTDIVEGLETYIKKYKPDVLAMAVVQKSFLETFFYTSITQHFIQEANLPMLTFRKTSEI